MQEWPAGRGGLIFLDAVFRETSFSSVIHCIIADPIAFAGRVYVSCLLTLLRNRVHLIRASLSLSLSLSLSARAELLPREIITLQ